MPATLLSPLPQFSFSRNPITVQISSNDIIATAGVKAVIRLTVTGAIANNATIRLTWSNRDILLKALDSPDTSGETFITGSGSAGHVAQIAGYLVKNYYLFRDYVITYAGNVITLTARKPGIQYSMTPVTTGSLALTVFADGVTEVMKPNFGHFLEVWLAGEQIYARTLSLDYPITGLTTKDVSDILHPKLGSDAPDLAATSWTACLNTFKSFFVKYAQYYGDNAAVKAMEQSGTVYINRGGFDTRTALTKDIASFLHPNDAGTLCLRQGSKSVRVQTEQPEFLYWINFTGAAVNVKLKLTLMLTDGSSDEMDLPAFNAQANAKYYVPVGFEALKIRSRVPSGKSCFAYSVRIMSAAGAFLSETYTYELDVFREFPAYFIYLNSLGGYQTLYTWGKKTPGIQRTKQDTTSLVTYGEAATKGRQRESNIHTQRSGTINTGFRNLRGLLLLEDLMLSEEIYLVHGSHLIPVGLRLEKLPLPADGENLKASSFEYFIKTDEWAFTDDPDQDDDDLNSTGGAVTRGYNWLRDTDDNDNNPFYEDI